MKDYSPTNKEIEEHCAKHACRDCPLNNKCKYDGSVTRK